MKTSGNMIVKLLLGTGAMILSAGTLLALCALSILNGLLPIEQMSLVGYAVHFVAVYIGCLISCGTVKEKKGIVALLSAVLWYFLLLFLSVVILDCRVGRVIPCFVAGMLGYGAALLTCIASKRRPKKHKVKFPSR